MSLALTLLLNAAHAKPPRHVRPPPRRPSSVTAPRPPPPVNAQLAPELLTTWIEHANAIKDNPPYLGVFAAGRNFPPPPCEPKMPDKWKTGLERRCFNQAAVTPPDPRLAADATVDNRVAILKHYVQKYHLPGFLAITQFTPTWFVQAGGNGRPGADDVNAEIGMVRYQLFLQEQEVITLAKKEIEVARSLKADPSFAAASELAAAANAEVFHRQRRLLDYWFPDGPVWTALLEGACRQDEGKGNLPFERCCFRQLEGCLPLIVPVARPTVKLKRGTASVARKPGRPARH